MVVTSEVSGFSDFAVVVQAPDPAFIDADPVERTVAENAVSGAAVGAPITATTPGGEALVYTLGGTDAASFAVDPATGQIRVGVGTVLDYEGDRKVYQVTVAAEDPSGARTAVAVTIRVTNVGLGPYDADGNEAIDRDEAIAAVADYFRGAIGKDDAILVIAAYFAG